MFLGNPTGRGQLRSLKLNIVQPERAFNVTFRITESPHHGFAIFIPVPFSHFKTLPYELKVSVTESQMSPCYFTHIFSYTLHCLLVIIELTLLFPLCITLSKHRHTHMQYAQIQTDCGKRQHLKEQRLNEVGYSNNTQNILTQYLYFDFLCM